MILLHDIVEVFHLPDNNVRAVFLVVALNGRFVGVAAVNGNRLGEPVAADRLLEKAQRSLFVPMLGEQKVNSLALLIDRTIEIAPLALYLDRIGICIFSD